MLKQILTLKIQKQQRNHTAVSRLEDLTKAGCFWFCKHGCSQCKSNPHRTWWDVISIHCTDGGHISRGIQPWSFQPRQVGGWGSLGKGQKKCGKVVLVPTCQHYFFNAVSCAFHSLTSMSFWRIVPMLQQASISVCMWDLKKRWQCANLCQVNEVVSHWRKEFVGKRRDASITRSRSRSQELERTMKMQGEDAWSIWEGFLFSCFVPFIFAGYCRILWFCLGVYW